MQLWVEWTNSFCPISPFQWSWQASYTIADATARESPASLASPPTHRTLWLLHGTNTQILRSNVPLPLPTPPFPFFPSFEGVKLREAHENQQDNDIPRPQPQPHRQPGENRR